MKHTILSISLSEDLAKDLDTLQKDMRFSGRSEMVRAGLRKLMAEYEEHKKLAGQKDCVLLVVHNTDAENDLTQAKHEFDDIIQTQIHNNLKGGKCLELFLLSGPADRIRLLHQAVETNKKIEYAKLIVT